MMDPVLEDYEFLDLSDASDYEKSRIKSILVRPTLSAAGSHRFQTPWNPPPPLPHPPPTAAAAPTNVAISAAAVPFHGVQMNGARAAENEDAARGMVGGAGAAVYQAAQPLMQPQQPPRPVVQLNPQAGVFVNTQPFPPTPPYASYPPQTPEVSARQQSRGGGGKPVNKRGADVTANHVGIAAPPPAAAHVIWNTPPPMGAPPPPQHAPYQFYAAAAPPPTAAAAMLPAMIVGQFSPVAPYPPPAPPPQHAIDEQELKEQVPYNHHHHPHHHPHHLHQQHLTQEQHHHHQHPIQRLPPQHLPMPAVPAPVTAPVTVTAPVAAAPGTLPPPTAVQIMPPKFSNGHPINSNNQLINKMPPANRIAVSKIENSTAALPNLQKKSVPIVVNNTATTVEAKIKVAVKEEKQQQMNSITPVAGGGVRVGEVEEKNATQVVTSSNDEQPIKQQEAKPTNVEPSPKPNNAQVIDQPVSQQNVTVKPAVEVPAQPVTAPVPAPPSYASFFSNSSSSPGVKHRYSTPVPNHSTEHLAARPSRGGESSRVASSVNAAAASSPQQKQQQPSHSVNAPHHLSSASPLAGDPGLLRLAEYLSTYRLDHRAAILRPRGLTNRNNYCYINATLQALLACPPLYNLLKKLPLPPRKSHAVSKSKTPIIDSMVQFVNEFEEMSNPSLLKSRREKQMARDDKQQQLEMEAAGAAFEPTYVYRMMNSVIRNESAFPVEGRQEDAEEFLSCLLNGLNDEMVELLRLTEDNVSNGEVIATNGDNCLDQDSDNEWKEISKKKPTITRRTKLISTPLSQIFQGQWRSRVIRQGASETDNIQPFFTIPLDIEKAQSVKEALDNITTKNKLEGFTCPKTNRTIEAYQQLYLEELPLVLLLHLKCFDFRLQTCSKIIKNVEFSIELKIEPKLMASSGKNKNNNNNNNNNNNRNASSSMKEREYKLFAVVYHDGKEATKGHYVTDVYHVGYGSWLRYDDANVRPVTQAQVLVPKAPRVPYLLYYRRKDTIAPPTSANAKPQKTAASES